MFALPIARWRPGHSNAIDAPSRAPVDPKPTSHVYVTRPMRTRAEWSRQKELLSGLMIAGEDAWGWRSVLAMEAIIKF